MRKIVFAAALVMGANAAQAHTCAELWQLFHAAYDVMRDEANDHPNTVTPLFTAEWQGAILTAHQIEKVCDIPDKAGFRRQLQAMERGN